MRIISVKKLKEFWDKKGREDSEHALRAWYTEVKKEKWSKASDIKKKYQTASIINKSIVIFNIKGNKYRLAVAVKYDFKIVYIRFIGTHEEYNKIKVKNI